MTPRIYIAIKKIMTSTDKQQSFDGSLSSNLSTAKRRSVISHCTLTRLNWHGFNALQMHRDSRIKRQFAINGACRTLIA